MDGATGLQAISHHSMVFIELSSAVNETLHASGNACPLLLSTSQSYQSALKYA